MGLFASLAGSAMALAIVLAVSTAALLLKGIETRGRSLEEIHRGIRATSAARK
jgi:hypothetical protein